MYQECMNVTFLLVILAVKSRKQYSSNLSFSDLLNGVNWCTVNLHNYMNSKFFEFFNWKKADALV